jgi:hypothetical protein
VLQLHAEALGEVHHVKQLARLHSRHVLPAVLCAGGARCSWRGCAIASCRAMWVLC